ncbi:MAG: hypothetical protein ACYCPW_04040 [Nitrososphaerales archaeon]
MATTPLQPNRGQPLAKLVHRIDSRSGSQVRFSTPYALNMDVPRQLETKVLAVPEQKPRHNVLFFLVCLASCAYLFDSVSTLTLPIGAVGRAPLFFQRVFDSFRNPALLLAIYLGSLLELLLLSRAYPKMKRIMMKI